jgi:hypothetical protein
VIYSGLRVINAGFSSLLQSCVPFFCTLPLIMSCLRFIDNLEWASKAPPRLVDESLSTMINAAFRHPSTTPATEDTTKSLAALARFGLVVEVLKNNDWMQSAVALAHYVLSSVLDSPKPPNFSIEHDGTQVQIPSHSQLIFYRIAFLLNVNIFVFSSCRKPLAFQTPTASCDIAFFHQTDTYHYISEFHVLAPSSHYADDAYNGPLNPSGTSTSVVSSAGRNSSTPNVMEQDHQETSLPSPAAVWRDGPRSGKRKRKDVDLPDDVCERQLKKAWYGCCLYCRGNSQKTLFL